MLAAPAVLLLRPAAAQANWPTHPVRFISSSPPAGASDILTRTLAKRCRSRPASPSWSRTGPAAAASSARLRREGRARRLHLADHRGRPAGDQRDAAAAPAVQSAQGFSPCDHHRPPADRDAGEQGPAGARPQGIRRAREIQARQAQLRHRRRRHAASSHRRASENRGRHRHPARALSRRAGLDAGPARRPYRVDVRQPALGRAAYPLRHRARDRGQRAGAQPDVPEIPTMAEQGYPQLVSTNWFGFAGPPPCRRRS